MAQPKLSKEEYDRKATDIANRRDAKQIVSFMAAHSLYPLEDHLAIAKTCLVLEQNEDMRAFYEEAVALISRRLECTRGRT